MRPTLRWLCSGAAADAVSSKLFAAVQSLSVEPSMATDAASRHHSAPTLETVCDALREFGQDARVATLGLRWMTHLDADDSDSRAIAQGVGLTAVLRVLQAHKNSQQMLVVREQCCRAVANMCMLCASEGAAAASAEGAPNNFADLLVDGNAVEMTLGVMTEGSRLSLAGKQRVAMALNNLLMFSKEGAHRAVAADGESIVATFIHDLSGASNDSVASDEARVAAIVGSANATDAALAALVRMATLPAPDNAAGVQYRYQLVHYNVLEAVTAALVSHATLVSTTPDLAVVAVPVLHKCWELLSLVATHAPNHVLLFEGLFETALRRKGGESILTSVTAACPPTDMLRLMQRSTTTNGSMSSEEGMDGGVAADMQRKLHDSFVACLTDLTASRKDLKRGTAPLDSDDNADATGASAVLPTESALGVIDSIASGAVSRWSVQILASCARDVDAIALAQRNATTPGTTAATAHYALVHLAQRHLALVSNLAEDDPFVASENTMAVLDSFLSSYLTLAQQHQPATAAASTPSPHPTEAATWMLPIVGHAFSCLWNILNTTHGRHSLPSTGLSKSVRDVVRLADGVNVHSEATLNKVEGSTATESQPKTEEDRHSPAALMRHLTSMGKKLVEKLDATVDAPEYVHSSVTRRKV